MSRPAARIKADAASAITHDHVVAAIAEIGVRQRERTRINTAMNDELALIRQKYEAEALPHGEMIKTLTRAVQLYCEANRAQLTQDGKIKCSRFASGEVRWRITPPKVTCKALETVLEFLRKAGLDRFIRVKEELNKEAILAEPDAVTHIKGLGISQKEEFAVIPFETELEEVA